MYLFHQYTYIQFELYFSLIYLLDIAFNGIVKVLKLSMWLVVIDFWLTQTSKTEQYFIGNSICCRLLFFIDHFPSCRLCMCLNQFLQSFYFLGDSIHSLNVQYLVIACFVSFWHFSLGPLQGFFIFLCSRLSFLHFEGLCVAILCHWLVTDFLGSEGLCSLTVWFTRAVLLLAILSLFYVRLYQMIPTFKSST